LEAFDVGIIGTGIHGVSAAYHLASRGVRPMLFDRGRPASGPTGLSSAICRAYYTNPFLAGVARDSIEMFEGFKSLIGRDSGFRRTGFYFLHPPADEPKVRQTVAALNTAGIEVELLEKEGLAERLPGFDLEGIALGAHELHAGYADPHSTTEGLLRAAEDLGAEVRHDTRVERLEPLPSGGARLITPSGSDYSFPTVLMAAGPWTRSLAAQIGVDLPLSIERHYVITFGWGSGDQVPPFGDLPGGYYLRPEGEDLFLAGPLLPEPQVDPDDFLRTTTPREVELTADALVRRVPRLAGAQVRGGWASLYDVSPDWQPVIGEIAPGIFVDAGTSGHGFKLAPALGKYIADLVTGEATDPALNDFSPARFDLGERLAAGYGDARILG
jgi:sarcosine oxidase, subunit beta